MGIRNDSVVTIDCHYGGEGYTSAYLVVENGRAAFVDTNTAHALPYLLGALDAAGIARDAVDYVIVTHIHLDHAGGAAPLMKACPNATLICHPRAARHLANPRRLVAAVKQIYGDEVFDRLYGTIEPIEESRIRSVADDETMAFGARTLRFVHTLGHASHHICIHDSGSNGVFTGDSFGLYYEWMTVDPERPFIMCLSTPTEFDALEARRSVERLLALNAERAYAGHFGELRGMRTAAPTLLYTIDAFERIQHDASETDLDDSGLLHFCQERVERVAWEVCRRCGVEPAQQHQVRLAGDVLINARGLAHNAHKLRGARAG
ncbi:MAG: MBL fold metallo-hydrolase [Candidatus Hydrogenedentes bacterium]|nr:MBL fold metallo-hydrolase [Candidatus Hydrogenedentota bacterium]